MEESRTQIPQDRKAELVGALARSTLGALPIGGSLAVEIVNQLIMPAITRRRDEWIESLARSLVELEKRVEKVSFEMLEQSESFVTTALHASQIALRTHQHEKLEMLRNAVLNAAVGLSPTNEDLQSLFLEAISTLTPCHVKLLKFLIEPQSFGVEEGIRALDYPPNLPWENILPHVPCLLQRYDVYNQIVQDLRSRGFLYIPESGIDGPVEKLGAPRYTQLALEFLSFITTPIPSLSNEEAPA